MNENQKASGGGGAVRTALLRGPCPQTPRLAARYFEEYLEKIRRSVAGIEESRLWEASPGTNSIGNLLLHLAGNLRLWVLGGLAGRPVERDRAGEFVGGPVRGALESLERVVRESVQVIEETPESRLGEPLEVQGYSVDRLGALLHAMEHFSYHTGQIVLLAKLVRGEDHGLEFYPQHAGE